MVQSPVQRCIKLVSHVVVEIGQQTQAYRLGKQRDAETKIKEGMKEEKLLGKY